MHLALLRGEFPGQDVRDGGVECDLDALARGDGDEAAGDVAVAVGAAMGADRLTAPACCLADLQNGEPVFQSSHYNSALAPGVHPPSYTMVLSRRKMLRSPGSSSACRI